MEKAEQTRMRERKKRAAAVLTAVRRAFCEARTVLRKGEKQVGKKTGLRQREHYQPEGR